MNLRRTKMKGWFEYYRETCPICDKSGGCMINSEGDTVVCIRNSSDVQFSNKFPSWVHYLKKTRSRKPKEELTNEDFIPSHKKAAPEKLHDVNTALLSTLSLSDVHYKHLTSAQRGLTDQEIMIRNYKSFPKHPWKQVKLLQEQLSMASFEGIPGFYENQYNWTLSGMGGFFIPYRNEYNQVVGFQTRIDNPPNDVEVKPGSIAGLQARVKEQPNLVQIMVDGEIIEEIRMKFDKTHLVHYESHTGTVTLKKGNRYFWFASSNKKNGTSVGSPMPVHVAVPTSKLENWETGKLLKTKAVWVTEGALKADIGVEHLNKVYNKEDLARLGDTFIGIAGTNVWRSAMPVIKRMDVETVNMAFDMDAMQNPQVAYFLKQMILELKKEGYKANLILWNLADSKGIDDLFNMRLAPSIKKLF